MSETRPVGISVLTDRETDRGRVIDVEKGVLARNDELAAMNRARFDRHGLLVLNVLSSPGSGKTTFLARLLRERRDLPAAVIVGDLATDRDADQLRGSGAEVVQITTGGVCHLEAAMVAGAAERLTLDGKRLLLIENVGNLVCPAAYDLGEGLRVVLISVTEGEDKPLKYPSMFKTADAVVINKMDLGEAVGLDEAALRANLEAQCPRAAVFAVSARTGAGMEPFYAYLDQQLRAGDRPAR
ncbi:MAG TPA: hydrogenase nickel incorporation protein HypB [Trueperaceae bacterium]|nr:hydrogenase nickel incorporation protein HypB [Trueperaceae bacterium]